MNQLGNTLKICLISLLFIQSSLAVAGTTQKTDKNKATIIPAYNTKVYDQAITKLYDKYPGSHSKDLATRIATDSAYFIGQRYLLGALGEGPSGKFDQSPLYRSDAFDCVTFVSTVIALAHSNNLQEFKRLIPNIRYKNGTINFVNRNHFMSIDWNKNNTYRGYVRDITYKILDSQGKPLASIANANINKPAWYNKLGAKTIKSLKPLSAQQDQQLLNQLHAQGKSLQQEKSVLLYIPLAKMYDKKGQPIKAVFDQIPTASIVEIVRPDWPIEKKIGTRMNVSHLGFAIRTPKGLMYREASLLDLKVIDIPLAKYLKPYLNSKTIKGINIQATV